MSLNDILTEALDNVSGAQLAGVISSDGLAVELLVTTDDLPFDRDTAELELGAMAANVSVTAFRLGGGAVRDIVVEADMLLLLLSLITPGYFAVLGLEPDANLGKARFAMQQMTQRLKTEL